MSKCSDCEAVFATAFGCRRHFNNVHLGKRFTCMLCDKAFTRNYALKQHKCLANQPSSQQTQNHSLLASQAVSTVLENPLQNDSSLLANSQPPCFDDSSYQLATPDTSLLVNWQVTRHNDSSRILPSPACRSQPVDILKELSDLQCLAQSVIDMDTAPRELINIDEEPDYQIDKLINMEQTSTEQSIADIDTTPQDVINMNKKAATGSKMTKHFTCTTCGSLFTQRRSLTRHIKAKHQEPTLKCTHCPYTTSRGSYLADHQKRMHPPMEAQPIEAQRPDTPEAPLTMEEENLYHEFGHLIEDSTRVGRLQNTYNIDLRKRNTADALADIFWKQKTAFKLNIAYGFILRDKLTGQLSYYYASRNTQLFAAPIYIGNYKDLQDVTEVVRQADLLEYAQEQRPNSRYTVYGITNAQIYVTKLIKDIIGDPGETEFEEYLLNSRSVRALIKNYYGERYNDKLCFFRCLAFARGSSWRALEHDTKNLLNTWTRGPFYGITIDDLDHVERRFNIRVFVYTLVSNERPFGEDGDINELLIAEAEAEESDLPPISAQLLRRSLRTTGDIVNLNCNHGHFSLITKLSSFITSWRCSKCDKTFNRESNYKRHELSCDAKVKYIYPDGGHAVPMRIFEKLADEGLFIDDQMYPYRVAFDFEALFTTISKASQKVQYSSQLSPVSFSIASNVPGISTISGKPFTEAHCCIDQPGELIGKLSEYLEEISASAHYAMREKYSEIILAIEEKQVNLAVLRKEKARLKRLGASEIDQRRIGVKIREGRKWKLIAEMFNQWLQQLPVIGFNSGRFDINLIRKSLVHHLVNRKVKVLVIKKTNSYMYISTPSLVFMDITNYLAVGTSYAKWLKAFNVEEEKGHFPYEWLTSIKKLDQDYLPPHSEFYSTLKQRNITEEEYGAAQKVWIDNKFSTMKDYLAWYNNLDVVPFLSALEKMTEHWKVLGIDMLKGGAISLPGLAYLHMFRTLKTDVIIPLLGKEAWYNKVRGNIVGGPSIIFNRYHEVGKTLIRGGKPVENIVGYDANSLYLWCIGQQMPTGHYGIWEPVGDMQHESVPFKPTDMTPDRIDEIITRNLSQLYHRDRGMESSFEEYVWCEWMRRTLSRKTGQKLTLRHHCYGNQKVFNIDCSSYPVDGFIPELGIILQYHGCIFHGHKCVKNADPLLMLQRRDRTTRVTDNLKTTGLKVIEMYQCHFYEKIDTSPALRHFYYAAKLPLKVNLRGHELINAVKKGTFFGVVECDIMVPWWKDGMREKFAEMTPIFKNTFVDRENVGPHMQEYVDANKLLTNPRKCLIGSYYGEKMVLITPLLQWYIDQGLVVTKIYSALQYKPNDCFKHLMDEVAAHRRAADVDSGKKVVGELFKLVGNSYYGKCITDVKKHLDISFMKEREASQAINCNRFRKLDYIGGKYYEVASEKKEITFKLPVMVAFFVYGYAKLRMLQFYYDFMDKYFDRADFECMSMDTDSLYMAISAKDLNSVVKPRKRLEYSFEVERFLATDAFSQRTPGLFKLEYEGVGMVALNSKTYSIWKADGQNKYSSKGLSKITNLLTPEQFMGVLNTKCKVGGTNRGFRLLNGQLAMYQQERDGLTYMYIKREVQNDGRTTTPLLV